MQQEVDDQESDPFADVDLDIDEIDWQSETILAALHEMGGEADTSQIMSLTAISNNDTIGYRVREKFEPAGIVETEQPPPEPGNIPPQIIRLTEEGEAIAAEAAERLEQNDSIDLTLGNLSEALKEHEERLERVEALAETGAEGDVSEEVAELRRDTTELAESVGDLQEGLDTVDERTKQIATDQSAIQTGKYGALSDVAIEEIATLKAGVRAYRRMFMELGHEDRLKELVQEERAKVDKKMGLD